ncbi:MAG: penicillin acylase family protein [Myxococcales bacterium]|nr:penicillin acylase family protein [Myxococcales bacterium]
MGWFKSSIFRPLLGFFFLFLPASALVIFGLPSCNPNTTTTAEYNGLSAEVKVIRDTNGIPHIYAKDRYDAFYAGGYEMARDRLFQMDLLRRRVSGRLAEVFGAKYKRTPDSEPFDYKGQDVLIRTYGMRYWAEKAVEEFKKNEPELYKTAAAFSAGVNAFIRDAKAGKDGMSLPYGFGPNELNYEPEEWTPTDTFAVGKMQAFGLSDTSLYELIFTFADLLMTDDVKFSDIVRLEPPDKTTILPGFPGQKSNPLIVEGTKPKVPTIATKLRSPLKLPTQRDLLTKMLEGMRQQFSLMPYRGGSNNWVISGKHTANGKPILANDPHLTLTNPPILYLIHYHADDGYQAAGFTFPGIPYVLLGHNNKIAWGATTARADVTDLYANDVKKVGDQLTIDGDGLTVSVRKEKLRIRKEDRSGFDEEDLEIEFTEKGSLFKAFPPIPTVELFGKNRLRIHWAGMAITKEPKAFYGISKAQDIEGFKDAMRNYEVGAQNIVCITAEGDIGYFARANQPIRQKLDPQAPPWTIMPGKGYDFTGKFVEDAMLPQLFNPSEGFIITANNDPVGTTTDGNPLNDPYYLSFIYDSGFRAKRIREQIQAHLDAGKKWDVPETQKLQFDSYSHMAVRLLKRLDAAWEGAKAATEQTNPRLVEMAKDPDLTAAVEHLKQWDRMSDVKNTGAPLFHVWMAFVGRRWIRDDMPGDIYDTMVKAHPDAIVRPVMTFLEGGKTAKGNDLADDKKTKEVVETGDEICLLALKDAIDHLKKTFPEKKFTEVEWGDIHVIRVRNDFGEKLLPPEKGRNGTVGAIEVSHFDFVGSGGKALDERFYSYHAAIMRNIVKYTDDGRPTAQVALFGGQSGVPDNKHFGDLLEDWRTGKTRLLPFTQAEVDAVKESEIVHKP